MRTRTCAVPAADAPVERERHVEVVVAAIGIIGRCNRFVRRVLRNRSFSCDNIVGQPLHDVSVLLFIHLRQIYIKPTEITILRNGPKRHIKARVERSVKKYVRIVRLGGDYPCKLVLRQIIPVIRHKVRVIRAEVRQGDASGDGYRRRGRPYALVCAKLIYQRLGQRYCRGCAYCGKGGRYEHIVREASANKHAEHEKNKQRCGGEAFALAQLTIHAEHKPNQSEQYRQGIAEVCNRTANGTVCGDERHGNYPERLIRIQEYVIIKVCREEVADSIVYPEIQRPRYRRQSDSEQKKAAASQKLAKFLSPDERYDGDIRYPRRVGAKHGKFYEKYGPRQKAYGHEHGAVRTGVFSVSQIFHERVYGICGHRQAKLFRASPVRERG